MKKLDLIKLKDILFIILGSILCAISINLFFIQGGLLSGGLEGIAIIISKVTKYQLGYIVIALNIPLFILCKIKLNKRFTLYSFIGMVTFSLSLIFTHSIDKYIVFDIDKLLFAIYGGLLNGIGYGLVFAHHGSMGGMDIITMFIKKKKPHINISKISFVNDCIIVIIGILISNISLAMYTFIAIYISSYMMNMVIKGLNAAKIVYIITDKEGEMATEIMQELGKSVTMLHGEGGYTEDKKKVVFCVVYSSEIPDLRNIISDVDDSAFITISDASEIIGGGFKKVL